MTVTNQSTGLTRQVAADGAGYYWIPNLLEGTYDLSANATVFKPLTQKSVNVLINTVTRADVGLEVGGVNESVTVEASAALLQTSKVDVNVNLEARAVGNLPLSNYRNFQSLINLVPELELREDSRDAVGGCIRPVERDALRLTSELLGARFCSIRPTSKLPSTPL